MRLNDLKDELKFLFISSDVDLKLDEQNSKNLSEEVKIKVSKSSNKKCDRCWHHVDRLIQYHVENICLRCQENLDGSGEIRLFF